MTPLKKILGLVITKVAAISTIKTALAVDISTSFPVPGPQPGPEGFINNFYRFGLILGGVLAFGAIVYGGVKYIFAGGNPSTQSDGREWIKGALWGLLLLASAYLLLNIINPSLTNLSLPGLQKIQTK